MAKDKTYAEMYSEASKGGATRKVTYENKKEWKEGETLVGKLVHFEVVLCGQDKRPVNNYVLETDQGPLGMMLGSGMDKQVEGRLTMNAVVAFTYRGKREITRGRRMNVFDVEIVRDGDGPFLNKAKPHAPQYEGSTADGVE